MIKNVIFDVGGVLLEWNPPKFLKELDLPSHFNAVFESLLWAMHDGGLVTREELIDKLPMPIEKEVFSHCVRKISAQLHPIPEMIDLFHALRRQGYKVYILSNMPEEMHLELEQLHDFFSHTDGGIFSYQVKAIKPQLQIYEKLLQQYKLYPEESIFIDDRLDNVKAAEKLKITGIHCQSPAQVKADLSTHITASTDGS